MERTWARHPGVVQLICFCCSRRIEVFNSADLKTERLLDQRVNPALDEQPCLRNVKLGGRGDDQGESASPPPKRNRGRKP